MNKDTVRIEEFLLIISFLIIIIGLVWQAEITLKKPDRAAQEIQNMLAQPPMAANTYLDNYSLYVPQGYKLEIEGNTVVVYNKESILTFYLGQGVELSTEYFEKMNPELEKIYGQAVSSNDVTTYTYAWKYDESHIELLLGQNDSYIVAIYPENKINEAVIDIALMFNSYQRVDLQ